MQGKLIGGFSEWPPWSRASATPDALAAGSPRSEVCWGRAAGVPPAWRVHARAWGFTQHGPWAEPLCGLELQSSDTAAIPARPRPPATQRTRPLGCSPHAARVEATGLPSLLLGILPFSPAGPGPSGQWGSCPSTASLRAPTCTPPLPSSRFALVAAVVWIQKLYPT